MSTTQIGVGVSDHQELLDRLQACNSSRKYYPRLYDISGFLAPMPVNAHDLAQRISSGEVSEESVLQFFHEVRAFLSWYEPREQCLKESILIEFKADQPNKRLVVL